MRDATLGVYLHVPFCQRICPYCDFAVVAARRLAPALERRTVTALVCELALRSPLFAGRRLESLYLGGGTPSLLEPSSVAALVQAVRRSFPPAASLEVTLEVNPSTLERERLPGFRAAGVNRLSIGVQSFDDRTLQRLGRAHKAEEARRTLAAARAAGFENVSIDLIFGVPDQDRATALRDVAEALHFGPEHVSAYGLTVEAGTPYARGVERGVLRPPDDEAAADMLEGVAEALEAGGLARYEISSFARPGYESVHNRRYWERRPVLGLGVGAWSSEPPRPGAPHGARRANPRELEGWLVSARAGRPCGGPAEVLAMPTARGEAAFLALRTRAGLAAEVFAAEFGRRPRELWGAEIAALCTRGLLEESPAGDLRLTPAGVLLSDSVFEHFVAGSAAP